MDRQQLKLCLLALRHLLGRISDEGLVLLSVSPDVGVGIVEGSGVQGATKENEEIDTRKRNEAQRLYWK